LHPIVDPDSVFPLDGLLTCAGGSLRLAWTERVHGRAADYNQYHHKNADPSQSVHHAPFVPPISSREITGPARHGKTLDHSGGMPRIVEPFKRNTPHFTAKESIGWHLIGREAENLQ